MATQPADKSFSELEREAERTRADLIHTVDALHDRASPDAIKEEMKVYARQTGNELIHTLERKARENPLQTAAIAAGLAYPAWRFLINIPAPILLVGAGLALTQIGGSSRASQSPDGKEGRRHWGGSGDASPLTESVTRTVQDAAEGLKNKVADAAQQAKSGLSSGLEAVRSRTAGAISDATDSARVAASETITAATDAVSATIDAASRTGDQLSETLRQSSDNLLETMQRHPFLVGGVGLLLGAVVASALPVSDVENRLFGDTSEGLKNRASDMASEGFELAKTVTHDVYRESVGRAEEQGLSPEVVRQTVRSVGDKVKNVVQQAADVLDEKPKIVSPASSVMPRT
jgi:Protein of unknown function (DUF3618)